MKQNKDMDLEISEAVGTQVICGDSRAVLQTIDENSIEALVTDCPYEINMMGKDWDNSGISFDPTFWKEVYRVLKPGAHGVVFGGARTFHRIAVALEDAGFEVRDILMWVYGSGMPHGINLSKAVDRKLGAVRDKVPAPPHGLTHYTQRTDDGWSQAGSSEPMMDSDDPITAEAQRWKGWNSVLKPAYEPILLIRKPVEGTITGNVMSHGVGGINIDATRVPSTDSYTINRFTDGAKPFGNGAGHAYGSHQHTDGRYPPNVLIDSDVAGLLDSQSSDVSKYFPRFDVEPSVIYYKKASVKEKNHGLAEPNTHSTVKPVGLMKWLCRLITPTDGVILDPFAGTFSTSVAAIHEGFDSIGIEMSEEYVAIGHARIAQAQKDME